MDNWNIEQNIYEDKLAEEVTPILSFESYVPDDFIYAPEPDIWYRYSITDPITGGPIVDPSTNLYATDFIAYSVEYEGEYYWTYNVYREEVDGSDPLEGSEELIDKYAPAESKILLPQSMGDTWNIEIESMERDLESGDIEVGVSFQTTYPFIEIANYDLNTKEYDVIKSPSYDIGIKENYYIYANDELISDGSLFKEYLFYDIVSVFPPEVEFDEESTKKHEVKFDIDYSLIDDKELELKIVSKKIPNYVYPLEGDYVLVDSTQQVERFVLPTNQDSLYNVSFDGTTTNETISIPYSWDGGENNKWEQFRFEKLFENTYKYPTTTKDLLMVSYTDGYTNEFPDNEIKTDLSIEIEDYPIETLPLKKRYDGDHLIFYVDENMYYDYQNEEIIIGESNGKFENEKGLVLPWDKITNGNLNISFSVKTYKEYTFNVQMKIGNLNKLRGDGGKYEIEEV